MNFAIIDIETTGGSFYKDRITEIAIIKHNGTEIIDRFQSLINPLTPIPSYITQLTGIDESMVSNAPKFFEIAKQIVEFTQDCFFVAHNVNFDYGFVREAFKSLGYNYQKKTLCTVKMSRKLIPGLPSYSLGKLCLSLDIELKNHHRAMADAQATSKVFELLYRTPGIDEYIASPKKQLLTYKNITDGLLEKVNRFPEKTGVYFLKNKKNEIIYIGKSINIKKRVFSHLYNEKTAKAIAMKNEVSDFDFELTNDEFIALLLENELVKQHQPKYNRALKQVNFPYGIISYTNQDGFLKLDLVKNNKNTPVLMAFKNKFQGLEALERLEKEFHLCQKINRNENRLGACFNYTISLCKGACENKELPEQYNLRVQRAVDRLGFGSQNFAIVLANHAVYIKKGQYAGFSNLDTHLRDHFNQAIPRIDRDAHYIVYTFLNQSEVKNYQRIEF